MAAHLGAVHADRRLAITLRNLKVHQLTVANDVHGFEHPATKWASRVAPFDGWAKVSLAGDSTDGVTAHLQFVAA